MLDKAENNCYNHHSEIQKGTNSNLPYTFGMSRQRVCGPALIPWTVPCGMSLYVKALTAIIAYLALLLFRVTGSAFSGTLANTRLVKSAGGNPPALLYLWTNKEEDHGIITRYRRCCQ